MSEIRKKVIEGLAVGDTFSVSRVFTAEEVLQFGEISRDYNPIHYDERFAKVKNFSKTICHGLLAASLITEIGGQLAWLATVMSFRFKKPVYCGDTVICDFTLTKTDDSGRSEAQAVFTNQNGATVIEAELSGILPGKNEISVMRKMLAEGDPTNKARE